MSVATEVLNEGNAARVNEEWQTVHRVVFPTDGDTDTLPLYLDFNAAQRVVSEDSQNSKSGSGVTAVSSAGAKVRTDFLENRRQLHLPAFRRVSFGTYFNAFPASYWRAHTDVTGVRLTVAVDAPATVVISRSTARGTSNRVESITVDADTPADVVLPLANFGDGGWYWFDLVAGSEQVKLLGAEWSVRKPEGFVPGTATVAVTTFNRPDYCVKHLTTFAESPELLEVVDRLLITDQGTQKVRDQEGFTEAAARLGRLRPRHARDRRGRPQQVCAAAGRRRHHRDRGRAPRHQLRRLHPEADDRRRPHVQPLRALCDAHLRRGSERVQVLLGRRREHP